MPGFSPHKVGIGVAKSSHQSGQLILVKSADSSEHTLASFVGSRAEWLITTNKILHSNNL